MKKRISNPPKNPFLILQIIWFALMASVIIHIVVAHNEVSKPDYTAHGVNKNSVDFLIIVCGASLIAQVIVCKKRDNSRSFMKFANIMHSGDSVEDYTIDSLRSKLIKVYANKSITLWALAECPIFLGLVLTLQSGDIQYTVWFCGYFILNMFFFRPKRHVFEKQLVDLNRYMQVRGNSSV